MRWPRLTRVQRQSRAAPTNDADRALARAYAALSEAERSLAETHRETSKIRREVEFNHFGQDIFQDFMRRRTG